MRILVVDIAAESSGALSVLQEFHGHVLRHYPQHEWIFLLSKPRLESAKHVKVMNFDWVKKSWFHRLWWDRFGIKKVIRETQPDIVFSLQNMAVKATRLPQAAYVHNALLFQDVKNFSFFKGEGRHFAIYQHIIGPMTRRSLKRAGQIIVQTETMKQSIQKRIPGIGAEITVAPTNVSIPESIDVADDSGWNRNFIYPATPFLYKDHRSIIGATRKLLAAGYDDFTVRFTFTGKESSYAATLVDECRDIPQIEFCGVIPRDELYARYVKSTLVVTSYCESYAVPLAEAKKLGIFVLAADVPYAREVLENYPNCLLSKPLDSASLFQNMKQVLDNKTEKMPFTDDASENNSWDIVVKAVLRAND